MPILHIVFWVGWGDTWRGRFFVSIMPSGRRSLQKTNKMKERKTGLSHPRISSPGVLFSMKHLSLLFGYDKELRKKRCSIYTSIVSRCARSLNHADSSCPCWRAMIISRFCQKRVLLICQISITVFLPPFERREVMLFRLCNHGAAF